MLMIKTLQEKAYVDSKDGDLKATSNELAKKKTAYWSAPTNEADGTCLIRNAGRAIGTFGNP